MRQLAWLVAMLIALTASANERPIVVGGPPPATVAVPADSGPLPAILPAQGNDAPAFGLDLFLGMVSGLRMDGALWRAETGSLRVEGYYGALLTKFGPSEMGGAGLRWQTRRNSKDGCHSIHFGPGCDVFFHFEKGNLVLLAPSVELAWNRTIGDTAGWVLGINAGLGVPVSGRDTDGDEALGRVTPLISGFTGFRY